jgi:hypothetical protein
MNPKQLDEMMRISPALAIAQSVLSNMQPPKKPKRRPLLIDEMLALQDKHMPKDWRKDVHFIQQRLRAAKVFSFDNTAACYAAQMMVDHPEAIARDIEFCIPPYERMYIEFPYPDFFNITSPPEYRGYHNLPESEEDQTVGYLYDGPLVYVMSRAGRANVKHPMVLPIRFRLNRNFTYAEELLLSQELNASRLGIDSFFWGSCTRTLYERKDTASLRALREHNSCEFWYANDIRAKHAPETLRASTGDLRNIIGFILFMNRTRDVQIMDDVAPAPGFVRAKPRTLVRHNVIRIKLDPRPLLKRVFHSRATGGWRREHDVRGHFCCDRNYHAHKHDHDMREIDIHHWKCLLCGGQKWWRKAHHRGRKDLGQVKTAYEVTK